MVVKARGHISFSREQEVLRIEGEAFEGAPCVFFVDPRFDVDVTC